MEFIHLDNFIVPSTMPVGYFLLVLIYVLKKNVDRWFKINWKKRKGELYLVAWWLAMLMMYVVEFATHGQYRVPQKMIETCILILLPFGSNAISKIMHKRYTSVHHNKKIANVRRLERLQARS